MIDDFKRAWVIYQLYKEGKMKMEKTKEFLEKHTKEILISLGFIAIYQFGYKRGFRTGMRFENALVNLSTNGGK